MYIPFCVRLATQAQCARGLRPPIAQPHFRFAVIACLGILFTPRTTSRPPCYYGIVCLGILFTPRPGDCLPWSHPVRHHPVRTAALTGGRLQKGRTRQPGMRPSSSATPAVRPPPPRGALLAGSSSKAPPGATPINPDVAHPTTEVPCGSGKWGHPRIYRAGKKGMAGKRRSAVLQQWAWVHIALGRFFLSEVKTSPLATGRLLQRAITVYGTLASAREEKKNPR
jgi:hypothetical protein